MVTHVSELPPAHRELLELADKPLSTSSDWGPFNSYSNAPTLDILHKALFGFPLTRAIADNRLCLDGKLPHRQPEDPDTEAAVCGLFRANVFVTVDSPEMLNGHWRDLVSIWPRAAEEAMGTEKSRSALRQSMVELLAPFRGHVAIWRDAPAVGRLVENGPLAIRACVRLMLWHEYARLLPADMQAALAAVEPPAGWSDR